IYVGKLSVQGSKIGIDRHAAINGADDAVHFGPSGPIDRKLRYLRDIGMECPGNTPPAKAPRQRWRAPTGLFGGKPEDSRVARLVLQHREPFHDAGFMESIVQRPRLSLGIYSIIYVMRTISITYKHIIGAA